MILSEQIIFKERGAYQRAWVIGSLIMRALHLRPHQQCIGITSCAHSANNNSFIGNNLCKIPSIHVSWSFQSGIFYVKSPTCVPLSAGRWPSQRAWLRLVMVGLYTMQSGSPTPGTTSSKLVGKPDNGDGPKGWVLSPASLLLSHTSLFSWSKFSFRNSTRLKLQLQNLTKTWA